MNRLGKHFTDPDRNNTSVDIISHEPVVEELAWFEEMANFMQIFAAEITAAQRLLVEERAAHEETHLPLETVQPPFAAMQAMPAMPQFPAMQAMQENTQTEAERRARRNRINIRLQLEQEVDELQTNVKILARASTQLPPLTEAQRAENRVLLGLQWERMLPII